MAGHTRMTGNLSKLEELVLRLNAGKVSVSVGVHGEDSQRRDAESGLTNAQLAAIHEYGSPEAHIPIRSFIRAPLAANRARYKTLSMELLRKFAHGEAKSLRAIAMRLGTEMLADMRSALVHGIAPPLKPGTVAAKRRNGYARPDVALYATGALYAALKVKFDGEVTAIK